MQDIQALLHYSEGTCDLFLFLGEKGRYALCENRTGEDS